MTRLDGYFCGFNADTTTAVSTAANAVTTATVSAVLRRLANCVALVTLAAAVTPANIPIIMILFRRQKYIYLLSGP